MNFDIFKQVRDNVYILILKDFFFLSNSTKKGFTSKETRQGRVKTKACCKHISDKEKNIEMEKEVRGKVGYIGSLCECKMVQSGNAGEGVTSVFLSSDTRCLE